MFTELHVGGEAQLVDHADLEGLVVVAAQHVLDCGDVYGRILLGALLAPRACRQEGNNQYKTNKTDLSVLGF